MPAPGSTPIDAGSALWDMADLVTPMALRVAATLRVADHIVGGARSARELAEAAGADAGALDRLLQHLVVVGVVAGDDEGGYTLTALGAPLLDDHPSRLRSMLDIDGALGRGDLAFAHLLHAVRTGEAAFDVAFGRPFWEDLASDPARTASYDAQMGVDVAAWAPPVIVAYDWGALGHVVDVGGGSGTLLAALLDAVPDLRGTVLDQPATAAAARRNLAAAGLSSRSDVVAGSFFDPLPAGAGGYVLCAVLHDWDDRAARIILQRCAEAAGSEGRVLVVEKTGAGGESPHTDMDLRVLAYFGGRERGVSELVALAAEAGLRLVAAHDAGELSVVELVNR